MAKKAPRGILAEMMDYGRSPAPAPRFRPVTLNPLDRFRGPAQPPKTSIGVPRHKPVNEQSMGELLATIGRGIGPLFGKDPDEAAADFQTVGGFLPAVGDAMTANDAKEAFGSGHYLKGGALAAAAVMGVVPGLGKAAGKGVKGVLSRGAKVAEEMVPFRHYSFEPNLTRTDPAMWGTNRTPGFTPRDERARMSKAPGRTYIGLDDGPRPYSAEGGVGPHEYRGAVPKSRLYDMAADPDGLKDIGAAIPKVDGNYRIYNGRKLDGQSLYEHLIKDAGYAGYHINDPTIGHVGALFEPWDVKPTNPPMKGLPARIKMAQFGPDRIHHNAPSAPLRDAAKAYAEKAGIEHTPPSEYVRVLGDPEREARAKRIAQAYEDMPHAPNDPAVRKSYQALADETLAQHQTLTDHGYSFSFYKDGKDPYGNPWNATRDLRKNKSLQVYPTDAGYGERGITPEMEAENPMLARVPGLTWDGKPVRVNDVFRGVHDAFGHAKEGVGFRADGEENAYRAHAAMYSPEARRALATETRGQNSWLNFGPHAEQNQKAKLEGTVFADQKIGLMPDWTVHEGNEDFLKPPAPATPAPSPSSGTITADGVLRAAASKRKPGGGFADWRTAHDPVGSPGDLFDYSRLSEVPDVPQVPLARFQPPRGPSERIVDALSDPRVEQGINDTVRRGAEMGGKDWYNTEPLRQHFLDTHGPEEGSQAYGRFMDAMAATSPRSTVQDNLRTGSFYHYLRENGLPIPEKPAPGYGSVAQGLHRGNMEKLVDGDGWDLMANPKPASFSQNLQGNQHVATIDTHNFRLPGILSQDPRFLATSVKAGTKGNRQVVADSLAARYPSLPGSAIDEAVQRVPVKGADLATYRPQEWVNQGHIPVEQAAQDPVLWSTKPQPNEYAHYEDWQRQQAAKLNMSPAQYQASMWVGGGDDTGLASAPEPFLRTLESRVKYTADRLGLHPRNVLDALVRGKTPLLSAGAGLGLTGVLSQGVDPAQSVNQ